MLDLGELRAGITVDTSGVPRALSAAKRHFDRFMRGGEADSERSGRQVGQNLGGGVERGVPGPLGRTRAILTRFMRRTADDADRAGQDTGHRLGSGIVSNVGKHLGGAASGLGGVLKSGGKLLAGFAAGGVLALGTVAAAGAAVGVSVASSNEQALISFTTMLKKGGDTADQAQQRARGFIKDLQSLAATTPFEFADLQQYASSLVAAGIETDKIIPMMRNLGDVTAGVGTGSEGIDRATVALQQMSAAQRITGEDLNQLRDAGIPVYDLLAGATGKSKAEIVKLAQAGKLGKEELDALLDSLASKAPKGLERFSGMMAKQSQSLEGVVSTLKDNLSQGLAGVMDNALPLIKQGVGVVSTQAARLFSYLDEHRDSITVIFETGGRILSRFGRIASAAFGGFTDSLSGGQSGIEAFAGWLSDHEADITGFFVSAGSAAIGFAKTAAQVAITALRAYAGLSDGVGVALDGVLYQAKMAATGLATLLDAVPGMDKAAAAARRAADGIQAMRDQNNRDDGGAAKARRMADALENGLVPALDGAQHGLDKMSRTQIDKARMAEQAAKVASAIRGIGTDSQGSQIKLKRWSDVSHLGAAEQRALRGRISDSRRALREQIDAARDAGAGQEKLTKTWETGKRKLYDEFRQMGLSKAEARRLAAQYAGIKPKVSTKVEQPGMRDARANTRDLDNKINGLNDKTVTTTIKWRTSVDGYKASYVGEYFGSSMPGQSKGKFRGGILDGDTPVSRGDDVWLPRADGRRQPLRGGEGIYVTEAMRDPYERARLLAVNKAALAGERLTRFRDEPGHAAGGITRDIHAPVKNNGAVPDASRQLGQLRRFSADLLTKGVEKSLRKQLAEASAGAINVNNPTGRVNYKGGTFTNLFAANLRRAEKIAGVGLQVFQGGFRPSTSYSGTSHAKDAIDLQVNYALGRALRKVGIAAGDRTGLGNWVGHIHAVPTKGAGYAGGSAVWQAADYQRRGGARQSMRSPWGLWTGTAGAPGGFNWTAEKAAELVVNPQLRNYSGGERVLNADQTKKALAGVGGGQAALINGDVILQGRDNPREDVGAIMFALRGIKNGSKV